MPITDNPSRMKEAEPSSLPEYLRAMGQPGWHPFIHLNHVTLNTNVLNTLRERNDTFNNTFTQLSQARETDLFLHLERLLWRPLHMLSANVVNDTMTEVNRQKVMETFSIDVMDKRLASLLHSELRYIP